MMISLPGILCALLLPAPAGPPSVNLALGRPYRLRPRPNYSYCTDRGDRTQLTDGIHAKGYFWTQKETVGWVRAYPVLITIDLGKEEPIGGLSFRTAFGTAGVHPPEAIYVFAGKDGKSFRFLGDLAASSNARKGPPSGTHYQVYTYKSMKITGRGRYVALAVVPRGSFVFCDEIEVYEGDEKASSSGGARPLVRNLKAWVLERKVSLSYRNRLRSDLKRILLAAGDLNPRLKGEITLRARRLEDLIPPGAARLPGDFRSLVPSTPLHESILALHAPILRARGVTGLTAWHSNRYAPLDYLAVPPRKPAPRLEVFLMKGEYRAETLNLTNPGDVTLKVRLSFRGAPGGPAPAWIRASRVLFVDTASRNPVADALPVVPPGDKGWTVTVPPGLTRQVWFTFHPVRVPPGDYDAAVRVESPAESLSIPLRIHVSSLRFPARPRLSLGLWDYTDDPPAYDITPQNRSAAIADMKAHFVDSPWAHRKVLPWPPPPAFDGEDRLKGRLDFSNFDRWTARWPEARHYCVFLSVGSGSFGGFPPGHPRFERRVGAWARAVRGHLSRRGIAPSRLALLVLDEPHDKKKDAVILAWARALHRAVPSFTVWEDPTHRRPEKEGLREMFEACDVLSPNLGIFLSGSQESRSFYLDLVRGGKRKLWFYQCSGPVRELCPYAYDRLQGWYCWKYGAVGSGFWAYADSSKSAWNVYKAPRAIYSPVYIESDRVTGGKHFEAVREGVEDYEYLRLLEDELRTSKDPGFSKKARALLEEARRLVPPGGGRPSVLWRVPKDYGAADRIRRRILSLLEGS